MELIAFSNLVLSTKELSSRFLKKALVFQKICFKVLKTFKISSDCHMKTCRSLKRRAILKIPCTVEPIRRTYAFLLALKVKFLFQEILVLNWVKHSFSLRLLLKWKKSVIITAIIKYAWIWLNMPKETGFWICLGSYICQNSEYDKVLNMAGFSVCDH